jgi:hypothetical protein
MVTDSGPARRGKASRGGLDDLIASLSVRIEKVIAPFAHQVQPLGTISGIDQRTAQGLLGRDRN